VVAQATPANQSLDLVLDRLGQIRATQIWPHGPRDLMADALGVLCLVSLYREFREKRFLAEAEWVAQEVDRILGRRRGIRMAERADGEGQSYRSQALWIFALHRLGQILPPYRHRALSLVREIHAPFVRPGAGIISRMKEDLSGPYFHSGPGALEVLLGLAVYRQLGEEALGPEIEELEGLVSKTYRSLAPDQGAELGLLLWATHFFPTRPWAFLLRERSLAALDGRWVDPPGYFRRDYPDPGSTLLRANRLAITNLCASIGLQAQGVWANRVSRIHGYFLKSYPWESDTEDPLAPILACVSLHPGALLAE
jgi:hypothetical protein